MNFRFLFPTMAGLIAAGHLFAAPVPDAKQLAAFEKAFTEAWKAHDVAAIKRLMALDGVPESAADITVYFWEEVTRHAAEKKDEWGGMKFEPLSEALAEKPGRNIKALRKMVGDQVLNGRQYVQSVPVSGTATLYIWGESATVQPVGIDHDGQLKIAVLKPKEGITDGDKIGTPIEAQGFAEEMPDAAEVARFCAAVEVIAKAGKWQEVICTDGATRYAVDLKVDHFIMWTEHKEAAAWKAEFIPVAEMFGGESPQYQKEDYQPQRVNGRRYAFNLPFAGMVKISRITDASNPNAPSSSIQTPVGITAAGELKMAVLVPVKGEE